MTIITKDILTEKYKVAADLVQLLRSMSSVFQDPANAREGHDVSGIAASLNKYGQRTPLVVNADSTIEKGNGTFEAAQSLNWTHVAVVGVDDDPVTATGYSIADNELGDKSRFNLDKLHKLMSALPKPENVPGFDLERLEEIRALVASESIDNVEFPEYDESVANEVEYLECPSCGEKWPK